MPYIKQEARYEMEEGRAPRSAGELNWKITRLCDFYLRQRGGVRYENVNEVIGVLECAKLELYRRIAAPYEDAKLAENGDAYTLIKK